jgi:LPXTG-motif cell wall-anchored protein
MSGAALAQYADGGLVTDQNTYAPGEAGTAVATNLDPSRAYQLDFSQSPGVHIASARTNAQGRVAFAFRIPNNARPGAALLTAHPANHAAGRQARRSITISGAQLAATPRPGGISLPKTGRDILVYGGLGLLLLILGATMIAVVRQRRRAHLGHGRREQQPTESTRV